MQELERERERWGKEEKRLKKLYAKYLAFLGYVSLTILLIWLQVKTKKGENYKFKLLKFTS